MDLHKFPPQQSDYPERRPVVVVNHHQQVFRFHLTINIIVTCWILLYFFYKIYWFDFEHNRELILFWRSPRIYMQKHLPYRVCRDFEIAVRKRNVWLMFSLRSVLKTQKRYSDILMKIPSNVNWFINFWRFNNIAPFDLQNVLNESKWKEKVFFDMVVQIDCIRLQVMFTNHKTKVAHLGYPVHFFFLVTVKNPGTH
jgi:hypothetical protein